MKAKESAERELIAKKMEHKENCILSRLVQIEEFQCNIEHIQRDIEFNLKEIEKLDKMDLGECFRNYSCEGATGLRRLTNMMRGK